LIIESKFELLQMQPASEIHMWWVVMHAVLSLTYEFWLHYRH